MLGRHSSEKENPRFIVKVDRGFACTGDLQDAMERRSSKIQRAGVWQMDV